MDDRKISTLGYGFALVSPQVFEQCRKDKKVKTKKMISYFSKDNDFFYYCISKGALMPIHHINYDRYTLIFSIGNIKYDESLLDKWEIQAEWNGFNLHVDGSNEIWAIEIEEMEKWDIKKLNSQTGTIEGLYYDIEDNEHIEYKAIRYSIPSSKYEVEICGLTRKNRTLNGMENYGFLFNLKKIASFESNIDPSEVNFNRMFHNYE